MRQPLSLMEEERRQLQIFARRGKNNACTLTRTHMLLKRADGWKDKDIIAAFAICQATVTNVYKSYAEGELEAVLHDEVQQ